ncbi:toxic anion resistance protein [Thauera sinica]|uniref:Toxic anion resistance protein n=1 Tax=Thauera sinica TaxID=2665146 RepID=A0ABW1AML6_9RHOO|nr:toxic anion resistance protein [Thauera sp. K11]ATE60671.1 toxic anion resistance protein [Thauera sp. K11]
MSETTTLEAPAALEAPEVLTPVPRRSASDMVPVKPERQSDLERRVDAYVHELLQADFGSESFRKKMDESNAIGRKSIAESSMLTGRFMDKNFIGLEDSPAFRAINELRDLFEDLNPAREGDLLAPNKILGLIPFGSKLKTYLRKVDSAGSHIGKLLGDLRGAQDELRRDVAALGEMESRLWQSMGLVKEATVFAEALDTRLSEEVKTLRTTDTIRAEALEQEVLFYARQALSDLLAQQAVNVNAYRQVGVWRKAGRELINGCDRMATTGISALATAQGLARAAGTQIKVMDMLKGSSAAIGDLIEQTSVMLGQHVERIGEFSSNPVVAIEKLKTAFENTTKAIDNMDNFRSQALENMAKNNAMLKDLITGAEQEIAARRGAVEPREASHVPA